MTEYFSPASSPMNLATAYSTTFTYLQHYLLRVRYLKLWTGLFHSKYFLSLITLNGGLKKGPFT